jgi:hypothetical protein
MKEKSFSKKKLITEFLNFDWENYINSYDDLSLIETKEDAWYHWINYGKHENRVILKKVVTNKNNVEEFEEFDWKSYVKLNDDLSSIESKEEAWNHWINHGKNENRVINVLTNSEEYERFDWETYVKSYDDLSTIDSKEEAWKHWISYGKNEKRVINGLIKSEEYEKFDWKSYVSNYNDLLWVDSKEEAWNHWINHGKNENRICENIFLFDDFKTFDWKKYINNYDDLTYIDTEKEAWKHFILYGFNEGRKLNDVKEIELNEFKKIIEVEESFENIDFSLNKIYFKRKYSNCGKHFFGWKSSMNYLLENYNFINNDFNKKYYFDEWIEKLLVWGNKIQNEKCLTTINEENLQLITFLHGPPFENYNSQIINKNFILNDDSLLNKNIIDLINSNNLLYSITFLYVLSIHHKNYIINNYPQFKNKVLSVYHPIDINNYEKDDLFSIRKFTSKKNIYHIGWWLRNFTSFCDFNVPKGYNKFILLKQEFKKEFNDKFSNIEKSIQIVNELDDNHYKEIFSNSCIFCDLADAIANNVVLECIKYNTPIIVRRLPSVEEYLGVDYPLFFDDVLDLSKFSDQKTFHKKIIEANEYLQKMDKTPFMLETFLNKITYDVNKLKVNNDKHKLTWLCYLNNEDDDIERYIAIFNNQLSLENIKLIIINSLTSKIELLEKYKNDNISIINIESHLNMNKIYDLFFINSTTEYLTFKNFNNINTEENYSDLCINYLENNPTFDIVIFKSNETTIEKIDTYNDINSINIFKINDDSESESSNPSDVLSQCSDKNSDTSHISSSNEKINNLENKIETALETDLEAELEIDLEAELEIDSISEESELENKVDEQYDTIQNNEILLTFSQIHDYDFDDKNINILWRKSIHSYVNSFDENFWLNCHKNNFNIFEINYNNLIIK